MLFLNFKPIIMFPSKYKTLILGAPKYIEKNITKNKENKQNIQIVDHSQNKNGNKKIKLGTKRKKWASELAYKILLERNDSQGVEDLFVNKKYGKPDDCSDVLLMCISFCYMVFIDDKKSILNC